MIELKNISKIYPNGFCALKNIDLKINQNEVLGVIGYSGAGKSTLVRLINRLEEPSSGEVSIEGKNILHLKAKELRKQRQKIGMIFQHFNLLSGRNVFENVAYSLEVASWKKNEIKLRVMELLNLVGLEDKAKSYPSQLSGGQKQRVAIARALANHPKILLCDEATSALDSKTTRSILELLQRIQSQMGLTIVFITHQIEVVRAIATRICVMNCGEIVEIGEKNKIFANPNHWATKEIFLYSNNALYSDYPERGIKWNG